MRLSFVSKALSQRYPDSSLVLVTDQELEDWGPVIDFHEILYVDSSWLKSTKRSRRILGKCLLFFRLFWRGFDWALYLHSKPSLSGVLRLCGIKRVLGVSRQKKKGTLGYHQVLPRGEKEGLTDFYLRILKEFDCHPTKLNFKLKLPEEVHSLTERRLEIFDLNPNKYLVVAPGEGVGYPRSFDNVRWPFFTEFLQIFLKKTSMPILLLGEVSGRNVILPITDLDPKRIHTWAGQATRMEMLAALNSAWAFVGSDIGLSHLAGCVGVPGVVLFGPSHSSISQPPGLGTTLRAIDSDLPCSPCQKVDGSFNWSCNDNVCVKSISPQRVWEELNKVASPVQ